MNGCSDSSIRESFWVESGSGSTTKLDTAIKTGDAEMRSCHYALLSVLLACLQGTTTAQEKELGPVFTNVACGGTYQHHLQGICTNDADAVYWSFTTTLVKTDKNGKVLKKIAVENHHGDLCFHDNRVYVAVNLGRFNDPKGNADSWVYVYDAGDLAILAKHEVQDVFHGAGGIGFRGGHFYVVGGLPEGVEENYAYEYDPHFKFIKKHTIASGHTHLGIQTSAFADGHWWFGCYGTPRVTLKTDADFKMEGRYIRDCSMGIVGLPAGNLLVAKGPCRSGKGCTGIAHVARADADKGLVAHEPFDIEDRGETIAVSSAGRPLLEYQLASRPRKSYVSRLFSPAGVQILRDAPQDHLHHHSLMFAVAVDGVDFWSENDACGSQKPVGKAVTKTVSGGGLASATIEHRLDWMAPNAPDPLLTESRTVAVLRTEKLGATMLVWKCRLSPPPGRKSATLTGSTYFGLGARFIQSMDADGHFQNADGKTGVEDTNDRRSAWCAYSAKADGKPVTFAMFDCPTNPRHPATWFTLEKGFAYLAATLDLSKRPLIVEAGKPLELRYGVALWDGQVSKDQIHAIYREFAKHKLTN